MGKSRCFASLVICQGLLLASVADCSRPAVDPLGERSTIQNAGSDSMVIVALVWAERFSAGDSHPGVSVSGGGTGHGIAGLTNGTVGIANATRRLKPSEIEAAETSGFTAVETTVGFDAPAFIVHLDSAFSRRSATQRPAL